MSKFNLIEFLENKKKTDPNGTVRVHFKTLLDNTDFECKCGERATCGLFYDETFTDMYLCDEHYLILTAEMEKNKQLFGLGKRSLQ